MHCSNDLIMKKIIIGQKLKKFILDELFEINIDFIGNGYVGNISIIIKYVANIFVNNTKK